MKIGGSIASIFDSSTTDYKEEGLVDKQHQPTKQKQRIVNRGTLFYMLICMLLLCDALMTWHAPPPPTLAKPPKFFEPFLLLQLQVIYSFSPPTKRERVKGVAGNYYLLLLPREVWQKQVPRAAFIEERERPNTPTGPNPIPTPKPNLPHSTPSNLLVWFGFLSLIDPQHHHLHELTQHLSSHL